MPIAVRRARSHFEREPLVTPLGFKGHFLTELWQAAVTLESSAGHTGVGVGTQSVLWSDAKVFSGLSEQDGNALMFALTQHAARSCERLTFDRPEQFVAELAPIVNEEALRRFGVPVRATFALNALAPVDAALWQIAGASIPSATFDGMTKAYKETLRFRHQQLGVIPLISYGVSVEEAVHLATSGHFLLKIKLGNTPSADGDQASMLDWDRQRMSELHAGLKDLSTSGTESGRIAYYLDANGRYQDKQMLASLIDHCDHIGALNRVVLLEEPFPEEWEGSVADLPVRVAADESVHSVSDLDARFNAGYGAIALKPAAKTLSLSLQMAQVATAKGMACFCADLTANPIMLEWAKNVAARLPPLPGLCVASMESNGAQNYTRWAQMIAHHPLPDLPANRIRDGRYTLDEEFYDRSGGAFLPSAHYRDSENRQ